MLFIYQDHVLYNFNMILKNEFTIDNLSLDPERSFSPIRLILKDENLYNKVMDDDDEASIFFKLSMKGNSLNLGNEINSYFYKELKGFFDWGDSFLTYLQFLVSNSNRIKFIEILEDARISIQNFRYLIQFNNIFDSLVEYRKIIEGALWVSNYVSNPSLDFNKYLNHEESFTKKLEQFPGAKNAFKIISKYIHKDILHFDMNVNNFSEIKDIIKLINNSFEDIKTMYERIYQIEELSSSILMNKMKNLCDKYLEIDKFDNRSMKMTKHSWIKSAATQFLLGKNKQEIMSDNNIWFDTLFNKITSKSLHFYSLSDKYDFFNGIHIHNPLLNYDQEQELFKLFNYVYEHKYFPLLKQNVMSGYSGTLVYAKNYRVLASQKSMILNIIASIKTLCIRLLEVEVKGSKRWEFFYHVRVLLMNYAVNTILRKAVVTHSLVKINELIRREYPNKLETFGYKHIKPSERILYADSDGKTTGHKTFKWDDLFLIEKTLNLLIDNYDN